MVGYRHKTDCNCKLCFKIAWNKGLTKIEYPSLSGGGRGNTKGGFLGKKHSLISKKKMSEKKKGIIPKSVWKNGHIFNAEIYKRAVETKRQNGSLGHTEEAKRKIRLRRKTQIFPIKDTKIEVKIQMFLKELGYEFFTHQYMKGIEHGYQCDILIPILNLVIECDGDYWHKYPIGNEIDHIRTKELFEKGFKVLRLWENEINDMNINNFKERLKC